MSKENVHTFTATIQSSGKDRSHAADTSSMKYIVVPDEVILAMAAHSRLRVTGKLEHQDYDLALMPEGESQLKLRIAEGKLKAIEKGVGDEIKVTIREDTSEYGMSLPQDLKALFESAPDIKHAFDTQLKPGKQRGLIHYIKSAKTAPTRTKRIARLMEILGIKASF